MYYFTADEHWGHSNAIKYCNRPFEFLYEMENTLIRNHNSVVTPNDITVHAGDFSFYNEEKSKSIIKKLNGSHIFLKGSHDRWLKKDNTALQIWEETIEGQKIVVCHYCMRTWAASHYNSWHLFAHSHGKLEPIGKSWDIGVDNNDFYPLSFEKIKIIMKDRPDNFNLVNKIKEK